MLLKSIRAAIRLPFLLKKISSSLQLQKELIKNSVDPVIKKEISRGDGSLGPDDLKKITGYYALAVPAVLGEAFCALRGYPMNENERWASTCHGALSALFDDFFDKESLNNEQILEELSCLPSDMPKKANERLFEFFYSDALRNVTNARLMNQRLLEVYHAQVESREQAGKISNERLLHITLHKGGVSAQFYRTAFSHPPEKEEEAIFYLEGGLLQLANDIFDVYKDRESGINTLVTRCDHISDVRRLFTEYLNLFCNTAYSLPYPAKNIDQYLDLLSIGVFSRCYVCLDHLQKAEQNTGGVFRLNEYSRSQLICDMDTKKNMLRSAAYFITDITY